MTKRDAKRNVASAERALANAKQRLKREPSSLSNDGQLAEAWWDANKAVTTAKKHVKEAKRSLEICGMSAAEIVQHDETKRLLKQEEQEAKQEQRRIERAGIEERKAEERRKVDAVRGYFKWCQVYADRSAHIGYYLQFRQSLRVQSAKNPMHMTLATFPVNASGALWKELSALLGVPDKIGKADKRVLIFTAYEGGTLPRDRQTKRRVLRVFYRALKVEAERVTATPKQRARAAEQAKRVEYIAGLQE